MYREYTPQQYSHSRADNFLKSYSNHKSTEIGSKSPYKSMAVSRLEDARRTIDEVIVDLNQKREMNDEAIREIRSVNSEIIDDFRRQPQREHLHVSAAQFAPQKSAYASTIDMRAGPAQDDSLVLRGRLNEELSKNNELILRLSRIQEENKRMKKQYQMSFGPSNENAQLRAENDLLRQKLAQLTEIPQQFFREIQELKRENQTLRGDTVRLLRKIEGF